MRVLAWSHSSESSLPGLQLATFSLCAPMAFLWCMHMERGIYLSLSSSYKATYPIGLGPYPMASFNLCYFLNALLQIQSHGGLGP